MSVTDSNLPTVEGAASAADKRASVAAESDLPEVVYSPESAVRHPVRLAVSIAQDIWSGRELAWRMFVRNIRGLYRQTVLGLFWAFLPPLANTVVWWFIKSTTIALDKGLGEVSYLVYVMTGMVIWQSFIEAYQCPLQAVQSNRNMLSKLRFPRESILFVGLFEILFNLCVRLAVLVPVAVLLGANLNAWALLTPLLILALILIGLSLGMFIMPFGMLYHDVGKFITMSIPVWMILTPIVYVAPGGFAWSPLNWLNPASPLLTAARDLVVFGQTELWVSAAVYAALALPLFVIGLLVYRLSIPILLERVSS